MSRISRRELLIAGAAAVAGGAVGAGANLERKVQIRLGAAHEKQFRDDARRIKERHRQQTIADVHDLRKRYESQVFGRMRVWPMIENLGRCIDQTDTSLFCTSQWVHVQQVLAAMEGDGIRDPDFFLMALLHDLGKVLLLAGSAPDHVVGATEAIGEYDAGVGLHAVVHQYGHPEFIYSRMKDHVPEHVAWVLRYHGCKLDELERVMDARDRQFYQRYLVPFRKYDVHTKSTTKLPALNWEPYRALIEERFPEPVLF